MSPLPSDPLDLSILLFKNMQNHEVAGGQLSGSLSEDIDFADAEASLEAAELLIHANAASRLLECHIPPGFFLSLDDVLKAAGRRISPLPRFYVVDSDCLFDGEVGTLPPAIRHYLDAAKLFGLLGKAADFHGGVGDAKTLVFLHKEKMEITPIYGAGDVRELSGLEAFSSDFVTSDIHKEQKQTILKTALLEIFSGKGKQPFSEILRRFDDLVEKVRSSYQLYVAEFSFQKVKAEVEKEKLDAMVKLNKVFSDIQSQLLAVPVALVLVGGQMEDKGAWTSKNVLIWLGALVFAALMDLLIRNQRHTLKAVKQEIGQQRMQIEQKYQSIAARFRAIYTEIDDRHAHQKRLISVVDGLVAMSLAVTTYLLLWFSGALPILCSAIGSPGVGR